MRYQANELRYEQITVLEKEAIFTELRVLRDSVPKGFSCYEVRHDDECQGNPVEIEPYWFRKVWNRWRRRDDVFSKERIGTIAEKEVLR